MGAEEDVLAANERFYGAFSAHDFEAMDGAWARELPVACVHPGWNLLHGRERVLASWAAILGNPAQPRVVAGAASARLLGETAIVTCREFVAGTPLVATNVFVREEGEWRLVHHHASPVAIAET